MELRSKLFIVTAGLLTVFTLPMLSIDCRFASAKCGCASTQAAFAKTTDKAQTKPETVLVTFIEIGAAKCIPCKAMQPIMKAVEEEYKGQVKVVFHDVWTPQGKADGMKYNIRMIPTQVFLDKDGKEYFRHEGYFPKDDLVKVIKMQGVK
jgi:thioredoxin 1